MKMYMAKNRKNLACQLWLCGAFLLGLAAVYPAAGYTQTPNALGGGIVINELLVDPGNGAPGATAFDTNRNGTASQADEFIEFYNQSSSAIDMSGWQIWDRGNDKWFTFPSNTVVQPQALVVVLINEEDGQMPDIDGNNMAFEANVDRIFGNSGDNVVLLNPSSNQYIQLKYAESLTTPTPADTPTDPTGGYQDFPTTAMLVGSVEDWGVIQEGVSRVREFVGSITIVNHTAHASPGASPGITAVALQTIEASTITLPNLFFVLTAGLSFLSGGVIWLRRF